MNKPRILIVDDNAMNVELVTFVLCDAGFDVESAGDADAAFARVDEAQPDLILMDIQLPGLNGLDVTRQLKSNPKTRSIVIVAFTAYAMKGDERKMLAAGCDGYLSKPIHVQSFAAEVRQLLEAGAA